MEVDWAIFSKGSDKLAIPYTALLVRLRRIVGDEFFAQAQLAPLKRLFDLLFFAGPGLILISLYLPAGGGFLVVTGILCLALTSLYWFAPYTLCRFYLTRRGYVQERVVTAHTLEGALAAS